MRRRRRFRHAPQVLLPRRIQNLSHQIQRFQRVAARHALRGWLRVEPPCSLRVYVLDGHKPVRAASMVKAMRAWEKTRIVRQTTVGDLFVSTIFLAIDPGWLNPPLLFETMAYRGGKSCWQQRYHTWAEAEAGHAQALGALRRRA